MNIIEKLMKLSQEDLYKISLEKDDKNRSTKRALIAQRIIWERAGMPFHSEDHFKRDFKPIRKI